MENEVIKKLNELVAKGFSKTEIEIDLGIPKNNLSSYLSGFKKIPPKYNEKILGYNSMSRKELLEINELLRRENDGLKEFIKVIEERLATKSVETAQKSSQNSSVSKQGKVVDIVNSATKNDNAIDDSEIALKIEQLQKAANSCADTKLGRLAKANYLKQIELLKK